MKDLSSFYAQDAHGKTWYLLNSEEEYLSWLQAHGRERVQALGDASLGPSVRRWEGPGWYHPDGYGSSSVFLDYQPTSHSLCERLNELNKEKERIDKELESYRMLLTIQKHLLT